MVLGAALVAAGCSGDAGDDAGRAPTTTGSSSSRPSTSAPAPGCGDDGAEPGRSDVEVRSGGNDRAYIRYVPDGLAPTVPGPLVVDLTAYSPATLEESFSGFTLPDAAGTVKADEVGAVVVMPEPVNGEGLLTWNVDGTAGWTDDQRFVADVIDDVTAEVCVAPDRVFVMGFAIGGVMASTLACEQPERFAAVATVSGLWDPPGCAPSAPVPVLALHGTDDHFLPFDGGVGDRVGRLGLSAATTEGLVAMATRPGAVPAAEAWAARNGCESEPTDEPVVEGVVRTAWSDCDASVEQYVIEGGSHTWPGSTGMAAYEDLLGPVSTAITANDVIWDFFTAHAPA